MFAKCKKDDIIDIIFPATSCCKKDVEKIKKYVIQELNLRPRILLEDQFTFNENEPNNEFPLNNAEIRFLQLKTAIESEESSIIWCARGGYGSGDLLPFLEKMPKIHQNKLFIGFSDIVSISEFMQQNWGWSIICAPVLLQLARREIEPQFEQELKEMIFLKKQNFDYEIECLNEKNQEFKISGPICGGCVSVLAGHFGGKYQMNFHNKILFLEDEGEDGERLDRYFRQIIENIIHNQQKPQAILLGNFLQANPHGTPKAENIQIAIANFVKRINDLQINIPIFIDKKQNLGHSHKMRPLLIGYNVNIGKNNQYYNLNYQLS